MSEVNEEAVFIGDKLRRRFAATGMSTNEAAGRLQVTQAYVKSVLGGVKPLTKTFRERLLSLIRQAEMGTLPEKFGEPKRGKPITGYCGSGANLPEDYEPAAATDATSFATGSKEKVEILRQRAERGEHLWHDQDNKLAKRIGDE